MGTDFVEFEVSDEVIPEEEYELPSYSSPGRILVDVFNILGPGHYNKIECTIFDYDSDSSVFWINEGMGIDYWLDQYCEFTEPGVYVIEGITGEYVKGDGWMTDDDEEWEYVSIRRATFLENLHESLEGEGIEQAQP